MPRKIFFFTLIIATFAVPWVFADSDEPFLGEVTADKVNVRAGPNLNFEVIYQFNKGDLITITQSQYNWYKLKLPSSCILFVNKKFLKKKSDGSYAVKGSNVNIRTGAGLNFNVVGQISKKDKVNVVSTSSEWYGINACENCFGWIYAKYVKFHSTLKEYEAQIKRKEDAKISYQKLLKKYNNELKKDIDKMKLGLISTEFEKFIHKYADLNEADEAKKKIDEINLKSVEIEHLKAQKRLEAAEQEFKDAKKIIDEKISLINKIDTVREEEKKKPPLATGIVEDVGIIINRPAAHKLCDESSEILYFITSEEIDLNNYIYAKVNIWGEVKDLANFDKKLIAVTDIEIQR